MKNIILSLITMTTILTANIEFKEVERFDRININSNQVYSFSNILNESKKSIVSIKMKKRVMKENENENPFFSDPFFKDQLIKHNDKYVEKEFFGSGVIITQDGYIVTNNHVVDGMDELFITLSNRITYKAKLIGQDRKSDLAVIKIEEKDLNPISFFNTDDVNVGDLVFAIGNPFGIGETITQGIVSAKNKNNLGILEYEDFIQTDADINSGNSGGALINSTGALIGINSLSVSRSGENVGLGFSISSNMVKVIVKQLIEKGKYVRSYLGVNSINPTILNQFGALIINVNENSPAAKIGLKKDDLIVEINNKKIYNVDDLRNAIGLIPSNEKINIKYLRNNNVISNEIELISFDDVN